MKHTLLILCGVRLSRQSNNNSRRKVRESNKCKIQMKIKETYKTELNKIVKCFKK